MSIAAIIVLAFAAIPAWGIVAPIYPVLQRNSGTTLSIGRIAITSGSAVALALFGLLAYGINEAPSEAKIWDLICLKGEVEVHQARDGVKPMCEGASVNCDLVGKEPPFDACAVFFTPLW